MDISGIKLMGYCFLSFLVLFMIIYGIRLYRPDLVPRKVTKPPELNDFFVPSSKRDEQIPKKG